MIQRVFIISILSLMVFFNSPTFAKDISPKTLEKYTNKISNKFTRTYCNTIQFGISDEGALEFAIGETNKEFKNNKLNETIDYSELKEKIVYDLGDNCQVYDFSINSLDQLHLN